MTLSLAGRQAKEEIVEQLRRLLQTLLLPGLRMDQREAILNHLAWMKRQREELKVNCRFETVPELRMTRITIEASHTPIPAMDPSTD